MNMTLKEKSKEMTSSIEKFFKCFVEKKKWFWCLNSSNCSNEA